MSVKRSRVEFKQPANGSSAAALGGAALVDLPSALLTLITSFLDYKSRLIGFRAACQALNAASRTRASWMGVASVELPPKMANSAGSEQFLRELLQLAAPIRVLDAARVCIPSSWTRWDLSPLRELRTLRVGSGIAEPDEHYHRHTSQITALPGSLDALVVRLPAHNTIIDLFRFTVPSVTSLEIGHMSCSPGQLQAQFPNLAKLRMKNPHMWVRSEGGEREAGPKHLTDLTVTGDFCVGYDLYACLGQTLTRLDLTVVHPMHPRLDLARLVDCIPLVQRLRLVFDLNVAPGGSGEEFLALKKLVHLRELEIGTVGWTVDAFDVGELVRDMPALQSINVICNGVARGVLFDWDKHGLERVMHENDKYRFMHIRTKRRRS